MKYFNFTFTLVLLVLLSCNSTNNSIQKISKNKTETQKMVADGFKKGIVRASDDVADCPYIIERQNSGVTGYFDPIDLPEEFKKDGMAIWFKFNPSRRMKRCEKANPVTLNGSIYLRN